MSQCNFQLLSLMVLLLLPTWNLAQQKRKRKPLMQSIHNATDPSLQSLIRTITLETIVNVEETFFVRISGTKYIFGSVPMNFFQAYQICRLNGGYLLDSKSKIQEMSRSLGPLDWPISLRIWTGGSSLSNNGGKYRWFTTGKDIQGSEFTWAPSEPLITTPACLYLEKFGREFVMKTGDCEAVRYSVLCQLLENHRHDHSGVIKRNKLQSTRMHFLFS